MRVGWSPSVGVFRGLSMLVHVYVLLMVAVLMTAGMLIDEMLIDERVVVGEATAVLHADSLLNTIFHMAGTSQKHSLVVDKICMAMRVVHRTTCCP